MKTDNEVIAEFMGVRVFEKYPRHNIGAPEADLRYYLKDKMKFHTSWDWLMPVVEKINEVFERLEGTKHFEEMNPIYRKLQNELIFVNIIGVHQWSGEFIKWYNTQPNTK